MLINSTFGLMAPLFSTSQRMHSGIFLNHLTLRLDITWNFFGSRHGKCSADGEAAVVKSFLSHEATGQDVDAKQSAQWQGRVGSLKSGEDLSLAL